MAFDVMENACATCIYRKDSPLDLERLENQIRDEFVGFKGFRVCHHHSSACCRGLWNAHKDDFNLGRIAQRLNAVNFVKEEE